MVHTEGASMLYGENQIVFRRNKTSRNPFWSNRNKEVGYLDVRHFLTMIGPQNRVYLRKLHLILDDASKVHAHLLTNKTNIDPRYTNDANLIGALKSIARDCSIKRLGLTFWGKRSLSSLDIRLLDKLCSIQVDELHINPDGSWGGDRVEGRVLELLKKEMVRPEPMFEVGKGERSQAKRMVVHPSRW
jgi:hypothetical protein